MSRLALLFDLDGTLVDTDLLHHAAFCAVLAERGRDLSLGDYKTHVMGQPNVDIMRRYFPGEEADHARIAAGKEAMFLEALGDSVAPVAGIEAVLDWAEAEGAGLAVVTNAPRGNAEAMLAACGLAHRFGTLIIGDECARPKPDPLPYQMAMQALGATPSSSVAFEDSRSGLRAAHGSGAYAFGLTTGLPAEELLRSGARAAIADYTDPVLWAHLRAMAARVA